MVQMDSGTETYCEIKLKVSESKEIDCYFITSQLPERLNSLHTAAEGPINKQQVKAAAVEFG